MRRIVSFVLLGLGVFALALGLLLRFYAYPQLAKVPLDPKTTSVAQGGDITALLILEKDGLPSPEIRSGLDLTSTRHVSGDLTQPEVVKDGDVVAWVEATRVTDDSTGTVVSASVRQLCLDRASNEAIVPCEGQYIEADAQGQRELPTGRNELQQPGLSFKFPFGTEDRGYQMYDLAVRKAVEARYDGEDRIGDLDVYRFVQEIPFTQVGQREVPGSLIGAAEPVVDADYYYSVKRTMWVEPVTGQIVKGEETGLRKLTVPGQAPEEGTTVFDGTLTFNDKTVNDNVADAKENKSKLALLTSWPIVMWIVGPLLILGGLALLLLGGRPTGRRSLNNPPTQREPVPSRR